MNQQFNPNGQQQQFAPQGAPQGFPPQGAPQAGQQFNPNGGYPPQNGFNPNMQAPQGWGGQPQGQDSGMPEGFNATFGARVDYASAGGFGPIPNGTYEAFVTAVDPHVSNKDGVKTSGFKVTVTIRDDVPQPFEEGKKRKLSEYLMATSDVAWKWSQLAKAVEVEDGYVINDLMDFRSRILNKPLAIVVGKRTSQGKEYDDVKEFQVSSRSQNAGAFGGGFGGAQPFPQHGAPMSNPAAPFTPPSAPQAAPQNFPPQGAPQAAPQQQQFAPQGAQQQAPQGFPPAGGQQQFPPSAPQGGFNPNAGGFAPQAGQQAPQFPPAGGQQGGQGGDVPFI